MDYRFAFSIRDVQEKDVAFIYNSFLKSFRSSPVNEDIVDKVYFIKNHEKMERYIESPDTHIYVAGPPGDSDTIYGYIIGTPTELIYAYVKQTRRRLTVATKLAQKLFSETEGESSSESTVVSYCFPTRIGLKWVKSLEDDIFPNIRFIQGL